MNKKDDPKPAEVMLGCFVLSLFIFGVTFVLALSAGMGVFIFKLFWSLV